MLLRTIIESLLSQNYQSLNLKKEYLLELKQYFSTFVHSNASNTIEPDTEEMEDWVEATLNDNENIEERYCFC